MTNLLRKLLMIAALVSPAIVLYVDLPTLAHGQAISGDLLGVVSDSSGAVIPNATVTATNNATGVKVTTKSNGAGQYHFVNLPVGQYSVEVSSNGMAGGVKDVTVLLNHQATANITASVSGASTTIEVTAENTPIDTTTHQIQNTFAMKEVQDLPTATVGLGVLNLSLLDAGVATSGGVGAGTGPSVSGQRPRNNNFTIEGVDNNSKSVTGPVVTIPNDAVENFTVMQNQFSPEFGHSSGGQFNQTIVSGTNQWHGRVYEYFQNRNLNAIDASNARTQTSGSISNPAFDNNRFGGQIGGPIWKDKAFFFTNQEYNPVHQAAGSLFICAPTALGYTQLAALPGASATNLNVLKQFEGTAAAAATANDNCGAIGALTTGGAAAAQLGEIDFAPSIFNNTFTSTNSLDFNLSSADQLRFRYIYQRNNATDNSPNIPAFFTTVPTRNHLITLSEYHTFTPTLTNEFRVGFNRNTQFFTAGNFPFPGLAVFPNLSFDDTLNQVGPDPNAPQFGIQNVYQATDNITWVKGKHNLKFGIEGRKYISPQGFTQRARGDYEYATTEEYILDQSPSSFGQRSTGNNTYYGDQKAIYVYGNDEYRITSSLTLNLGLRYEFTSVPFGMQLQSLNSAASVPGLIDFIAPQPQKTNFAPRIGFAWSPKFWGTTVIRGGYGMAYDVLYDNLGLLAVPPQFGGTCDVNQSVNGAGGCVWSPGAFLANGGLPAGQGSGLQTFPTLTDQRNATVNFLPPTLKLPYTETWNFGVEHTFGRNWVAEARYVGTRGVHLPVQQQLNVQPKVTPNLFLPTFVNAPDPATLAGLTTTLGDIKAQPRIIPAYTDAGFVNGITSFQPLGQSIYHGLQTQLRRSFSNGLQMLAAYTWSHAEDNSTADVFSTVLTPRRPQNSQNFAADLSNSALDRRHRLSLETIYDVQAFKGSNNWFQKNILGNWEIAPVWQLQSGEWFTPQSGVDSNLNGDSAPDRTVFNASGTPGTGTTVTPICQGGVTCAAGDPTIVAYVANNPNAQYIQAGLGALATAGRNTAQTPRINNWDLTVVKRFATTERTSFEFQATAFNVFNHSQFIPGSVNTVNSIGLTGVTGFVRVTSAAFG
ncbi:MAG TPA: TonB-dependent receptor, partial [Candidatus Angelobacter sp.]|nr:TonB-dependent receptor [Candidatus Angelobacter sp.]